MKNNLNNKNIDLGTAPLKTLMPRLALPSIAAQVVNILYNIVDRMYIGHIPETGATALTGLGVCMPLLMVISAFSAFAGMGGAPLSAIELGKKNTKQAENILRNSFFMLIAFSVILTTVFFIFKKPFLMGFGASESTFPFADEYLSVYLCGTIFVQLSLGLNTFISAQGHAKTAMISVVIGAVLNLLLDPLFIFAFALGVKGAALATIISQAVSAIWVLSFLRSKRANLRLVFFSKSEMQGSLSPSQQEFNEQESDVQKYHKQKLISFSIIKRISALGISPFIMQATESAIFIVFNTGLQKYGGDLYVGAMTIMQSIMQMALVPVQGFTAGVQPIISFNFGAKNVSRVKKTVKFTTLTAVSFAVFFAIIISIFPKLFATIFTTEKPLIELIGRMLPIYIGGMWFFGIQMSAQCTFVGMGKAKISLFIALLRKVILLIPLALILPHFFGVLGIYWSEPIASTTSAITSGIFLVKCMRDFKE